MKSNKVLVVAAHADDEVLGCGATIARHVDEGYEVGVILMTNGVGARKNADISEISTREGARDSALKTLGVELLANENFPDNQLDTIPLLEIAKSIESIVNKWGNPGLIYTHWSGDLNIDHQIVQQAVFTAFRPQTGLQQEIRSFEVLSSTGWNASNMQFRPNCYINISKYLEQKIEAMKFYKRELRQWPHARSLESIRAQAANRGALVGLKAAEAFCIERKIS